MQRKLKTMIIVLTPLFDNICLWYVIKNSLICLQYKEICTQFEVCCDLLWVDDVWFYPCLSVEFNSLRHSDAIWQPRSGSAWAQAPSHYENQYWLLIRDVWFHNHYFQNIAISPRAQWVNQQTIVNCTSSESARTVVPSHYQNQYLLLISDIGFHNDTLKITAICPRAQWVNHQCGIVKQS